MSLLRADAEVPKIDTRQDCPVCRRGRLAKTTVDLTFHQKTDRGHVTCRVTLPVSACPHCGFEMTDAEGEAIMDQAVRRAYEKLPPLPAKNKRTGRQR